MPMSFTVSPSRGIPFVSVTVPETVPLAYEELASISSVTSLSVTLTVPSYGTITTMSRPVSVTVM